MIQLTEKNGPLVSVITCTYTHQQYLPQALLSAIRQTYRNIEMIVVNDGGPDISGLVQSLNDPRVRLIQRGENRGYSPSLNEALGAARGKYVCYLDDDDLYYPHHVGTLVEALEGPTDCQVAYSDLYQVHCRVLPDGRRQILDKTVAISRDYDPFFEMSYNLALHVSVMHRRDLLDKVGLYNESVRVLSDWDLNRRMAFHSDFLHLTEITGEYYVPLNKFDRMSYRMRQDRNEFNKHFMTIRSTRPPKPWPRIADLSVLCAPDFLDSRGAGQVRKIWNQTFWPHQIYLALPQYELETIETNMPNLVQVPVGPNASYDARLDAALSACEGDCVAIVPPDLPLGELWVEASLKALIESSDSREGVFLMEAGPQRFGAVFRRDELLQARSKHPELSFKRSVQAEGFTLRSPGDHTLPFQFDNILKRAEVLEQEASWRLAGELYLENCRLLGNELWMKAQAAKALFRAGGFDGRALEMCKDLNRRRPTVDTLYLEGLLHQRAGRTDEAIGLLERAKEVLEWAG